MTDIEIMTDAAIQEKANELIDSLTDKYSFQNTFDILTNALFNACKRKVDDTEAELGQGGMCKKILIKELERYLDFFRQMKVEHK